MRSLQLHEVTNKLSLFVIFILYSNLLTTCIFTISCESYIPTVSYMATFRSHDGGVVLAMVAQSFMHLIVFIAFHIYVTSKLSADDFYFMLILEVGLVLLPITCAIVDESSGLDFNPMDDVHRFVTFALMSFGFLWVYFALGMISKSELTESQKIEMKFCWSLFTVVSVLVLITISQWVFAYTIYNNFFFNHAAESIFEWASITAAVRLPYHISRVLGSEVKMVVNKKNN